MKCCYSNQIFKYKTDLSIIVDLKQKDVQCSNFNLFSTVLV